MTIVVAKARAIPTTTPGTAIEATCRRASWNAGLTSALPDRATANANTALSRKLTTVSATITSPIGIRIGPRNT